MRVPKRIDEALTDKQVYVDAAKEKLSKTVLQNQKKMLNRIVSELVPKLKTDAEGNVLDTVENYRIQQDIDNILKKVQTDMAKAVKSQVVQTAAGITEMSNKLFSLVFPSLPKRFEKVASETEKLINYRIGLEGGRMAKGGFLESFLADQTLNTQIKSFVAKSVTGQVLTKDFITGLQEIIEGKEILKDGEIVQTGGLERQYQRYAFDMYQQYDAAYNSKLSDEFGMNYFIYQGGLVEDSRDFCRAHNNKVWTREEAADWVNWTPSMGEYPPGYPMTSKKPSEVPSYMAYPGYDPLVDRGGYNCRHMIGWISDELAFQLRPDLKETVDK